MEDEVDWIQEFKLRLCYLTAVCSGEKLFNFSEYVFFSVQQRHRPSQTGWQFEYYLTWKTTYVTGEWHISLCHLPWLYSVFS